MELKRIGSVLLLAGCLTGLGTGCVDMQPAGNAIVETRRGTYVGNELQTSEVATLSQAWTASHAALQELGFGIIDQHKDDLTGKIIAQGPNDKDITLNLNVESKQGVGLRIRVGNFGSETLSRLIAEKIHHHMAAAKS